MPRYAWLLLALVACGAEPTTPAVATTPKALAPGDVAAETALLSLVLDADGARFDAVVTRAIAYRGAAARAPGEQPDHALEVHFGAREPLVLPLSLGHPTDVAGEASSVWAGGGTILRAPYFGAGTRYVLVGERGAERLAEHEVRR